MSQIYDDFVPWGNILTGAAQEGYHLTPNFTILKALYYFSHLAAVTNDTLESPINGQPGHVYLPFAQGDMAVAAPTIQQLLQRPKDKALGTATATADKHKRTQ